MEGLTIKDKEAEVWSFLIQQRETAVHRQCRETVEKVLRSALEGRSIDNVTVVFRSFKRRYKAGNC